MSAGGLMPHRCTIERDRAVYAPDAHRVHTPDYAALYSEVHCRLVVKTQRVPDGVLAESPTITTYLLVLPARQDVLPGRRDRVTNVTDHAGNVIDPGPFLIEAVTRRTGGVGRSHISAALERQGGRP